MSPTRRVRPVLIVSGINLSDRVYSLNLDRSERSGHVLRGTLQGDAPSPLDDLGQHDVRVSIDGDHFWTGKAKSESVEFAGDSDSAWLDFRMVGQFDRAPT